MTWKYRINDIKASNDQMYIAFDTSELAPVSVQTLPHTEIHYDLPNTIAPFYAYTMNRGVAPTLQQCQAMYKAMYSGNMTTYNLKPVSDSTKDRYVANSYAECCNHLNTYLELKKLFDKVIFSFKMYEQHGIWYEVQLYGVKYWIRMWGGDLNEPKDGGVLVDVEVGDWQKAAVSIKQSIELLTKKGKVSWA